MSLVPYPIRALTCPMCAWKVVVHCKSEQIIAAIHDSHYSSHCEDFAEELNLVL